MREHSSCCCGSTFSKPWQHQFRDPLDFGWVADPPCMPDLRNTVASLSRFRLYGLHVLMLGEQRVDALDDVEIRHTDCQLDSSVLLDREASFSFEETGEPGNIGFAHA